MPDHKGAAAVPATPDPNWQDVESAAAKSVAAAAVTAIIAYFGNLIREIARRRRQQADAARSIEQIKEIIAPADPAVDDLRVSLQGQIDRLQEGQAGLSERIDGLYVQSSQHYTNLVNLFLTGKPQSTVNPIFGSHQSSSQPRQQEPK